MTSTADSIALSGDTALPRWRWLVAPLTAFLVTRALIVVIVLMGDGIMPGFNGIYLYSDGDVSGGFVNAWNRWDTPRYLDIVQNGYSYVPGYDRNNVAFYPLYPLTIAALAPIVGSPLVAGLLISNLCCLAALVLLYRLVLLKGGDDAVAARTVFYIAVFPTAIFFFAAYTESLFLLLSVACATFALRRQWLWAGVVGALASATRATGFLLAILVGFEWLDAQGWTLSRITERAAWENLWDGLRARWVTLVPILLIPLGLLLYARIWGRRSATRWRRSSRSPAGGSLRAFRRFSTTWGCCWRVGCGSPISWIWWYS